MITAYVSIGNSDDKLSQRRWAHFAIDVSTEIMKHAAEIHGYWHSLPNSEYQNAAWCIEIHPDSAVALKRSLSAIARSFDQDSIAWAEVSGTEFIKAES